MQSANDESICLGLQLYSQVGRVGSTEQQSRSIIYKETNPIPPSPVRQDLPGFALSTHPDSKEKPNDSTQRRPHM